MKIFGLLTASSLAAFATAQVDPTSQANATLCVSGAHVIVARASGEQPGYGTLNSVKDMVLSGVPDSNAIAVPYPATIFDPLYIESQPDGVGNMTELIKQYGDACPGHKMVLMGYSQGAHVIGDTLLGADYTAFPAFPNTTTVGQKYIDNIVAVVMMGDPANVAGQPFLAGNSTHSGFFPRNNTANWRNYGLLNKTVSYCDANDTFCDSGSSLAVHIGYVPEYGSQAANFVVEKFNAFNNSISNGTSSTGGSTSTTSGAPSATSSGTAASSTANSGATSLIFGPALYGTIGVLQCIMTLALTFAM